MTGTRLSCCAMIDTALPAFIKRYCDGSIDDDATWRAYDVLSMITPKSWPDALKESGFKDEHQIASYLSIQHPLFAQHLTILWHIWKKLSEARVPTRRVRNVN